MNNLTKVVLAVSALMLTTSAFAWEKKDNPDRFISLGLSYDYDNLTGDYGPMVDNAHYIPVSDSSYTSGVAQADLRFPLSNNCTLEGRVRYNHSQTKNTSLYPDDLDSDIEDLKGVGYGLGVRFYFNGK